MTLDFLDAVTPNYNPYVFKMLKMTYVPQVTMMVGSDDFHSVVEDYQYAIRQCWAIIKEQKSEVVAEELLEFLEFAFNAEIMEAYQRLGEEELARVSAFHKKLCSEVMEYSSKYWLILRSFFNHLMFMFASKPHLMRGLEDFVIGFGTTRECRSLDADVKLWKL
jgi:hypothetical protein